MLVIDCETSILNRGNPFDYRNKLCYIGLFDGTSYDLFDIHYGSECSTQALGFVSDVISSHDLLVGFNLKFDLHWLRRYGVNFEHCDVWDCQLVSFILSNQTLPYPSLSDTADRFQLGSKLSIVDDKYWSKDIDTPEVPRDVLEEYLKQDLFLTYQVYQKQVEEIELKDPN